MDHDKAFRYYIEHNAELRAIVVRSLHGHGLHRVDEFMSDVVLFRLPRILADHDPDLGTVRQFVRSSLRWYMVKHLRKLDKQRERERSTDSYSLDVADWFGWADDAEQWAGRKGGEGECLRLVERLSPAESTDARLDAVAFYDKLKRRLSPDQLRILRRRFGEELSIDEICKLMGISKTTCYARLNEALGVVRGFS